MSVSEIDGATVRLQLEGACGSCPSSTMTMKMGLERRLLEKIPEIEAVVQVEPEGPPLTEEGIEKVLDEVRPFLNVAGGTIELIELLSDSAVPTARLKMTGSGAAINSVKVEITHRLKRNYVKLYVSPVFLAWCFLFAWCSCVVIFWAGLTDLFNCSLFSSLS